MQKLERVIAEAPRKAEETNRRRREELLARASEGSSRLDVSMALQDKRFGGLDQSAGAAVRCARNGAKAGSFFSCS